MAVWNQGQYQGEGPVPCQLYQTNVKNQVLVQPSKTKTTTLPPQVTIPTPSHWRGVSVLL